jgi:hypothetical protein
MAGSSWVRLDVNYLTNPKIMSVERDAVLLHLASILWCGAHLDTDGAVPPGALPVLSAMGRVGRARKATEQLVGARLYVPNGDGGWHLNDFESLNGSESEAERTRAAWRERQAAYRSRKRSETNP